MTDGVGWLGSRQSRAPRVRPLGARLRSDVDPSHPISKPTLTLALLVLRDVIRDAIAPTLKADVVGSRYQIVA